MRIVDYQKSRQPLAYRMLWALGVVSGVFSIIVWAFMAANNLRLKRTDPIHTPALQRLIQELKLTPENEALKEQIREMDYLARRAFFTSARFNQIAAWLLLGGVAVSLAAFKTLGAYHRRIPYPDSGDRKDDLAGNALWARRSVTAVGLVLFGIALSLALPWRSPLDDPSVQVANAPPKTEKKPLANAPTPCSPTREERAKHWPSFRGAASGHGAAGTLPTQWDGKTGEGILWKTALPLPGFSSPIVWRDRIFLSGGNLTNRAVYALDAASGKLLWEKDVPSGASTIPEVSPDTGYAAPTMATDGSRVFVMFATGDVAAFDFEGAQVWKQHLGVPSNPYGHSSSLEVFEDMLIVQCDQKEAGFVTGLDVRTGAARWRTARNFGASWASPALIEMGGRVELILVADAFVTSHDPKTGQEIWRLKCLDSGDTALTPVYANGLLYVGAEHIKLAAIDVKTRQVIWENKNETPGIGTPVASGGWLFAGLADGGISCWDAKSGRQLWLQETDDGFYASPIVAGNQIFLMERTGKMFIFEADGTSFKSVSQPALGEEAVTTPAIYGESLIYRGAKHVYRIGK